MKVIIFDASTLISISMNGLIPEFRELKKNFDGKFLITEDVKREAIDRPLTIKRFELEALRLNQLFKDKILELPSAMGVEKSEITKITNEMMDMANSMFVSRNKKINIIHKGEASCLALCKILSKKNIPRALAIDERTTRMLAEKPENLKNLLERKMRSRIKLVKQNFKFFQGFKIIRSTELMYIAYKKGLVRLKDPQVLDALLWALKFKGCSISSDEIREIKRLR